jgi:antitoxin FitA
MRSPTQATSFADPEQYPSGSRAHPLQRSAGANKRTCWVCASSAIIDSMATITIRQLDAQTKSRLRVRAAHHGRSMEEEAREILRCALTASSPIPGNLAERIRRRFARFGGIELPATERDALRDAPGFDE